MSAALVQSATIVTVAASSTTAPSITITGATGSNALVAFGAIFDNNTTWSISSVTDGGNTFVSREATAVNGTTNKNIGSVAVALNITGGSRTVAFNLAGTSGAGGRYYNLGCQEFSGVATSAAEDAWDPNSNINTAAADATAGPITTTETGDLIVGLATGNVLDNAMNYGSPASWANSYRQNLAFDTCGMDAGYWIPGSIQTNYSPAWTHDNAAGDIHGAVVVALKAAATGGTAALTGTALASITEADIVAGGKTIIVTLTGDTFIAN